MYYTPYFQRIPIDLKQPCASEKQEHITLLFAPFEFYSYSHFFTLLVSSLSVPNPSLRMSSLRAQKGCKSEEARPGLVYAPAKMISVTATCLKGPAAHA